MVVYVVKVLMGNITVKSVECTSEEILSLGTLLILISILAVLLNLLLIFTLVRNRYLKSPNNCLVANLAASDILSVLGVSVTSLFAIVRSEWQFSHGACVFTGYICHVFYSVSINICTFISFHRFISIVFPQRRIISTVREAQQTATMMWCLSGLACLPGVFREHAYQFNPVVRTCTVLGAGNSDRFYSMYVLAFNFIVPLCLMSTFYIRIYRAVQMPKTALDLNLVQTTIIKRKSKHLMIAVLLAFVLSWLPFNAALIFSAFSSSGLSPAAVIAVWIVKLTNTVFDPVLYGVCNKLYFRCMLRLLKCRGPLRSKLSAIISREQLQVGEYYSGYPTGGLRGSKLGSAPTTQPFTCNQCLTQAQTIASGRRFRHSLPSLTTNATQTARLSTVAELEDEDSLPEPEISAIDEQGDIINRNTCSVCSCRSSIPTVTKYPMKRFNPRSLSTSSQISQYAFGPTPTDSGRSSFVSQYMPTPSFCSNRTSFSSQFVPTPAGSARTSVTSQCTHYFNTPQGSSCNTPAVTDTSTPGSRDRRMPTLDWSRQSFISSLSASRSARSSLSSRISHYNPFSYSARSSVTSQVTSNSTPFSTRPSTPGTQELLNLDGELLGAFHPTMDSPRTIRRFSYNGRQNQGSKFQPTTLLQVLPQGYEMTEDMEETTSSDPEASPAPSPRTSQVRTPVIRTREQDTCSRLSVLMLGDLDPSEFSESLEEDDHINIVQVLSANVKKMLHAWSKLHRFNRQRSRSKADECSTPSASPRNSPKPSPRNSYSSPRVSPRTSRSRNMNRSTSDQELRDKVHSIIESLSPEPTAAGEEPERRDSIIDSIQKAVALVLSAKRFRSRVRSIVVPIKPDTPVPQIEACSPQSPGRCKGPLGNGRCSKFNVREPIRFVYERPIPNTPKYYTFGQKPMSRLRVPGRPPPLNVPQTILEEDLVQEMLPETPTTRRRKNASTWIAPPVIDVDEDRDDDSVGMRVECPGVLVEHHN